MSPTKKPNEFQIGEEQIALVERLSNASGVSGDEWEVRQIVMEEVRPYADSVQEDALGNVIAFRAGKEGKKRPRILLDAHMDEVGLMVTVDDGDGLFQFTPVGGVDIRQLPGKPVLIGKEHIPAVIGARAIHLTTAEERQKAIPIDTLRLDTGLPGDRTKKIVPGDRAVFATRFMSNGCRIIGKALDDRLGVAILIELLKNPPEHLDVYMVFSTQEEIGGRGARVAAYSIHPDAAIAIDSTPANDLPAMDGEENTLYNTRLGKGPAIYPMDRGTISDPRLVRFLCSTAEKYGIPYQIRQPGSGGTDAAAIHLQHEGIPSVSMSVPGRYAHTAAGLADIGDLAHTLQLASAFLESFNPDVLAGDRQ